MMMYDSTRGEWLRTKKNKKRKKFVCVCNRRRGMGEQEDMHIVTEHTSQRPYMGW